MYIILYATVFYFITVHEAYNQKEREREFITNIVVPV